MSDMEEVGEIIGLLDGETSQQSTNDFYIFSFHHILNSSQKFLVPYRLYSMVPDRRVCWTFYNFQF